MKPQRPTGMGAIRNWADDSELAIFKKYDGRKVRRVSMQDREVVMWFDNGTLTLEDDGQSCCELRYFTCDDDVHSIVGEELIDIAVKDGPSIEDDEVHDTTFVEILTTKGFINFTAHNEHNGYYGGFSIRIRG